MQPHGDLAPMESRSYGGQNRLHDMRVVGNTQLVRDGEQQRVGLRDRFVFPQLFDENIGLSGVAAAEDRPCVLVKETDLVLFVRASAEISAIAVIEQRENTAANGNARSARVASFLPRRAKGANLRGLLDVERLLSLIHI